MARPISHSPNYNTNMHNGHITGTLIALGTVLIFIHTNTQLF